MIYTATEDISTIYTAIDDFVDYLQQVLQYTPSVYLYGSVMTDDFTPNSDVNLLVVTPSPLTDVQTQRLTTARQFLAEVRETNNFLRINGAIICQADFVSGKAKGNVLEISVVNLWANRLIRDAALPPAEQVTKTDKNPFKKDHALFPSGLYGPVTLLAK